MNTFTDTLKKIAVIHNVQAFTVLDLDTNTRTDIYDVRPS
jgi:hypothetical protein